MKTTIRKELEALPYPYNKLALANEKHNTGFDWDAEVEKCGNEVAAAFPWSRTEEGIDFWSVVSDWHWSKQENDPLPKLPEVNPEWLIAVGEATIEQPNLTKREQFAMAALQGLIAAGEFHDTETWANQAKRAVVIADELIKALEEK